MGQCYRTSVFCLLWVPLLLVGCGKESPPPIVPVNGVITLGGQPLPKAQVRFIPQIGFGANFIATGVSDDAGRFTLRCNGQDGACATENVVVVSEADIPAKLQGENAQRELGVYLRSLKNRPIPQRYSSPVSSELHLNVSADQKEYNLQLAR